MPLSNFIKKRRPAAANVPQQRSVKSNQASDIQECPPPLQGFDQSGFAKRSSRQPLFAKSLDDVIANPQLFCYFLEYLEARKKCSKHFAQFVVDVTAFKTSYSLAQAGHASPRQVPSGGGFSAIFHDSGTTNKGVVCSDSIESFDSGIVSPSGPCPSISTSSHLPPGKLSEEAAKSVQVMAIGIYQSYIFPDSPSELSILPRSIVQSVIEGICTEPGSGQDIPVDCFDKASTFVQDHLRNNYLQHFLDSPTYSKYQLNVLRPSHAYDQVDSMTCSSSDSDLRVTDILCHEKLSSHFMEFMEVSAGRSGRRLLEFWLNVDMISAASATAAAAAHQKAAGSQGQSTPPPGGSCLTQSDALLIYEKFVSMQALSPIGFSNQIRCNIEEKICSGTDTVSADCFEEALSVVAAALDANFLSPFLTSPLFNKYLAELECNSSSHHATSSSSNRKLRRAGSTSSLTPSVASSSETGSGLHSIISNTLLATSSTRSSTRRGRSSGHTNFLDFYNSDPCHLFKRKHNRLTNIGHVNHLGRYTSCVSQPPEDKASKAIKKQQVGVGGGGGGLPMSRKLTNAMKRLVVSESEEQYREDMSWQMAELIVSEVIKLTSLGKPVS